MSRSGLCPGAYTTASLPCEGEHIPHKGGPPRRVLCALSPLTLDLACACGRVPISKELMSLLLVEAHLRPLMTLENEDLSGSGPIPKPPACFDCVEVCGGGGASQQLSASEASLSWTSVALAPTMSLDSGCATSFSPGSSAPSCLNPLVPPSVPQLIPLAAPIRCRSGSMGKNPRPLQGMRLPLHALSSSSLRFVAGCPPCLSSAVCRR